MQASVTAQSIVKTLNPPSKNANPGQKRTPNQIRIPNHPFKGGNRSTIAKTGTNGPGCTGCPVPCWTYESGLKDTEAAVTNDPIIFLTSVHSSKHDLIYGKPFGEALLIDKGTAADGKEHFAHVECDVWDTFRAKNDGADPASERIGPHILVEKL